MHFPARMALAVAMAMAAAAPAPAQPAYEQLRIIAPAAPGGGWDQTARAMQQVLQRAGIVRTPVVENIPGAAGTIGLARFISAERGNGDAVMVSGLIMLGGIVTHRSPVTLARRRADRANHRRVRGPHGAGRVAVPDARRPDPRVQGAAGVDLVGRRLRRRQRSDSRRPHRRCGRRRTAARQLHRVLGRRRVAVRDPRRPGVGRHQRAGGVRAADRGRHACACSPSPARERLPGLDAPTLREQGVDVEFENWRSIVAPPGISADDRRRLEAALEAMVRSAEWREMLQRYRWLDRYLAGEAFASVCDSGGSARPRDPAEARHGRQRGRVARRRRAVPALRPRRAGDLRRGRGRQRAAVVSRASAEARWPQLAVARR